MSKEQRLQDAGHDIVSLDAEVQQLQQEIIRLQQRAASLEKQQTTKGVESPHR